MAMESPERDTISGMAKPLIPEGEVENLTLAELEEDPRVEEFEFPYVNSILYTCLLIGLLLGWFLFTFFLEGALMRVADVQIAVIVLFFGGLVGCYFLLEKGLARMYTFEGKATLWRNRMRLVLKGKTYDIPYDDIKRVVYRKKRTETGLIFSAKKVSLYIEEAKKAPSGLKGDPDALHAFYEKLEQERRIYKMVKDMRK